MASSPLNEALSTLDATIESINNKVQLGIGKSQKYRQDIIDRLGLIVQELEKLKKNDFFQSVAKLKGELGKANSDLKDRTSQLAQTKSELDAANNLIEALRKQVDDINSQLKIKNDELQRAQEILTAEQKKTADKDKTIEDLNKQIEVLNAEKNEAIRNLNAAQTEINSLIDRLTQINRALIQKIEMIDRITQSLDMDNDKDVSTAFKAISDNIQAIMFMINNPSTSAPTSAPRATASTPFDLSLYNQFAKLNSDKQAQIANLMEDEDRDLVWSWRESALAGDQVNQKNIQNIFSRKYPGLMSSGGKRRRRTMKMRSKSKRRSKKSYKGGYVYSSSKELDKASSLITTSSNSNSSTKSRKSHLKKKRFTRKNK
jgi:predicted  nucleic acid-binding Zn-ribbon protein